MSKQSGLGDNFYVAGYDLSGNANSIDKVASPTGLLDFTTINLSAHARQGALRDGAMDFTTFLDPAVAHVALSGIPTADVPMAYFVGPQAVGNPAACLNAKQVGYDPTRANDGSILLKVAGQGNAFGLEWGKSLSGGNYSTANLLTGQSQTFSGGIGTWTATSVSPTLATVSSPHNVNANSLSLTSTGSGTMGAASAPAASITTQGFAVTPGQLVIAQWYTQAAATPRTCTPQFNWYTSGGTLVTTTNGTAVANVVGSWTLLQVSVTVPATAVFGRINMNVAGPTGAAEVHYLADPYVYALPTTIDNGGSTAFGAQAYLQVFSFAGTDVTVTIRHSTDNATYSLLSPFTFTQITSNTPFTQRLATSNTTTVNEFVQIQLATTGGFTSLSFALAFMRNKIAGVTF